jgi:hypothetical protein
MRILLSVIMLTIVFIKSTADKRTLDAQRI